MYEGEGYGEGDLCSARHTGQEATDAQQQWVAGSVQEM